MSLTTRAAEPTTDPGTVPSTEQVRREGAAIAFFGSWMLIGLFLDGWAHGQDKPETFFSPWHGVLYSGFVAALLWFGVDNFRRSGVAGATNVVPTDRLTAAGLALFVTGAVGDGIWHEIFGIEVDLEALLSPTHLLLLVGGFLMLTGPIRGTLASSDDPATSFRRFLPTAIILTLTAALVSFFTMYLSVYDGAGTHWVAGGRDVRELTEVVGVAAVLVTNLILLGPVVFALRHWRPPFGTFTLLFTAVCVAMTGLEEFDRVELALAGVAGGLAADLAVRAGSAARIVAGAAPLAMWPTFFLLVHATEGIDWTAELVAGSVVLAVASAVLLATLTDASGNTAAHQ